MKINILIKIVRKLSGLIHTEVKLTETMNRKIEKSTLQVELENEAKAKEIIEKEQIKELNRAMAQGLDLNKAAKNIYGPKERSGNPNATLRIKSKEEMKFNANWHE